MVASGRAAEPSRSASARPDPPLAEVDAEQPGHEGETDGSGVSTGTDPWIDRLTRLSIVGMVPTQSGQAVSSTSP